MTVVRTIVASLRAKIVRILRLQVFILFRLTNGVLSGVSVQHAASERRISFPTSLSRD